VPGRVGLAVQQRSPFDDVRIGNLDQKGQLMLPIDSFSS